MPFTKYTRYILFFSWLFLFFACSDDTIEKERTYYDLVNVICDKGGNVIAFSKDDATMLNVVESNTTYSPKNPRAFINYSILDNTSRSNKIYNIALNGYLYDVTTSAVTVLKEPLSDRDTLGNDPSNVLSAYIGSDYLNIRLNFLIGKEDLHSFYLVKIDNLDNGNVLNFELIHNKNKDKAVYRSPDQYICFDLAPYLSNIPAEEPVSIGLKWKATDRQFNEMTISY